jgi:hypothetical protein
VVDRRRAQAALRVGGLLLVIAWLFSGRLQAALPFWLPFAILAAAEAEFVLRGWRQGRGESGATPSGEMLQRRLPGVADADLGWVEATAEDGTTVLVPAPPRVRRRSALPLVAGLAIAVALFAWASRVDRRDSWSGYTAAEQARAESAFSAVAARIAGRPVRVRCDDGYAYTGPGSDAAGVAFPRRFLAYLEPQICRTLYRIRFDGKLGAHDDAAFAITVLAHEATHLRGIRNEAETECFAIQEGVGVGERLGVKPGTAHSLMRLQLDRDLSDDSVARLDYRLPAACRNGGTLDLRPADSAFP